MKYLFKLTATGKNKVGNLTLQNVYYTTTDKRAAEAWAKDTLKSGLTLKEITQLAEQTGIGIYGN